jgi:xanthine dehydrogenase YagT iron-sulfur-binding subunit
MSGNLCRCGAYRGITQAVLEAHHALAGAAQEDAA